MKKIDTDHIIGNEFFWLYYISASFPQAYDEESDTALSDFLYENYPELSDEKCEEWIDELVQFSEDAADENDGYIDDPNTIELLLNNNSFKIEFHPCATVYILNNEEIGAAEGEYKLRTLSWENFSLLTENCADPKIPLLILPVLALEEPMIPKAREIIKKGLNLLCFKKDHIDKIAEMIICGLL